MINNIFESGLDKSFTEIDEQFAEYHSSSLDCICKPVIDDNYLVHFWVEGLPNQND